MGSKEATKGKDLSVKERILRYKLNHRAPGVFPVVVMLAVSLLFLSGVSLFDHTRRDQDANPETAPSLDVLYKASFVGDINLARGGGSIAEGNGMSLLFSKTKYLWSNSDEVFGNLECVLLDDEKTYKVNDDSMAPRPSFVSYASGLRAAGFTSLQLANNHAMDYRKKGLSDTMEALENAGLDALGAGGTLEEALTPIVKEKDGFSVAYFAVSDIYPRRATATDWRAGVAAPYNGLIYDKIAEMDDLVDSVVVLVHWGSEYRTVENERQRQLAHGLADAGADVVIGTHPHTIEPIEVYNGCVVFYSLGNYVYDSAWTRCKDGLEVNYQVDTNGKAEAVVNLLRITNGIPMVTDCALYVQRDLNDLTRNLSDGQYSIRGSSMTIPLKPVSVRVDDPASDEPDDSEGGNLPNASFERETTVGFEDEYVN